jgi:hypothetical protein
MAPRIKMPDSAVFGAKILRVFSQRLAERSAASRAQLIPDDFLHRLFRECGIVHAKKQNLAALNACEQLHVISEVGQGVALLDIPALESLRISAVASDSLTLHRVSPCLSPDLNRRSPAA